jgi:hypothetical protein
MGLATGDAMGLMMATRDPKRVKHEVVEPIRQSLEKVLAPTPSVWGRENRVVGFDMAVFMPSQMPNAHLNIYGRTGLWAYREQLEIFNTDAIEFPSCE